MANGRERGSPLLRLTEHADPHATGIAMCAQSRSKATGQKSITFCAISAAPRLLGQRRARCVQSSCETPRDVWPLASRASPLHIGSEKKFYVPCTHCRRTKLCHTIPLAASTSNSRTQSRPAKRARDGIEWILRVPARPSRHPSVCARAESMTFRCFFVWPYKSSTPGRLLRLSLPCTHLPSYKLSSAGQRTLVRSHIHSANISLHWNRPSS